MRKIFTLLAFGAIAATASAQFQGTKFFDNWSIGIEGGATTSLSGKSSQWLNNSSKAFGEGGFWSGMRPAFGAEITKQITPGFGIALQDHAVINWTDSETMVDMNDLGLIGKVNLSNLLFGYNGKPRLFEVEVALGGGWRHYFSHGSAYVGNNEPAPGNPVDANERGNGDRDNFFTKGGLNFLFNLGPKKAWTIAVKPAVVWDMDGFPTFNHEGAKFIKKNANFELFAGVTYHFKSSNGEHYFTKVRPYDQAEVDALNANINNLRSKIADQEGVISNLQNEVNDLRNRKPQVIEKIVEKEKTTNSNTLETNVYFQIGKSVVPASQVPSVERVAAYLKHHEGSKVVIRGYASKDGPQNLNIKLAKNRAAAVKTMLVKKYGIDESRIDAQGNGISEMFSEPEWNRVSICTLNMDK